MTPVEISVIAAQVIIPFLVILGVFQVKKHFGSTKVGDFTPIEIEFVSPSQTEEDKSAAKTRDIENKKENVKAMDKPMSPLEMALNSENLPDHNNIATETEQQSHAEILGDYVGDFFTPAVEMPTPKITKKPQIPQNDDPDIIVLNHGRHMNGPRR